MADHLGTMVATDVHQHLWPEGFVAALARRAEAPAVRRDGRGWIIRVPGEPDSPFGAATHDPAIRAADLRATGLDAGTLMSRAHAANSCIWPSSPTMLRGVWLMMVIGTLQHPLHAFSAEPPVGPPGAQTPGRTTPATAPSTEPGSPCWGTAPRWGGPAAAPPRARSASCRRRAAPPGTWPGRRGPRRGPARSARGPGAATAGGSGRCRRTRRSPYPAPGADPELPTAQL